MIYESEGQKQASSNVYINTVDGGMMIIENTK